MKEPYKKLSDKLRDTLIARGLYDKTPDTNIESLNKSIVDNIIKKFDSMEVKTLKKSPLTKELENRKKKLKDKPIKTSLLLCNRF